MARQKRGSGLPILDAHNDTLILREARGDPVDFAANDPTYQVDLRRMRKGNMGGVFAMVGDSKMLQSLRLIDAIYAMCRKRPKDFALCLSAGDVRKAIGARRIALVMSLELDTDQA